MDFVRDLFRKLEELRRTVNLLQRGLVRLGTVSAVDTTACTVVVQFPGEDASGGPIKSHPMPWLQRSTEHRPPAVGDHAVVLDVSLGFGAAIAITGWPSTAKPSPATGTDHVLYAGEAAAKVQSPNVELGLSPTQYAAVAELVDSRFSDLVTWLNSHTHAGVVGTPGTPATPLTSIASVAASQVKVK